MRAQPYCAAAMAFALVVGQAGTFAAEQSQLDQGRRLFTQAATPPCALCHTLKAAGSEAAIGPALDELKPDADRVMRALRNGVGQMPSYASTLSEAEIKALAAFVAQASGGGR
jgi:sulfite dehydrogenase